MVHIRFAAGDGAVEICTVCSKFVFMAANQFCVDFVDAEVFTQRCPQAARAEGLCFGLVEQGGVEAHHGHADLVGRGVLRVGCGGNCRQA